MRFGMKEEEEVRKDKMSLLYEGFHPKNYCMKKRIDQMFPLLEQNNISLPNGAKKSNDGP